MELVVAVLAGVCQQVSLLRQSVLRQLGLQAAGLPAARPRPRQALRQTRPLRHQAWGYYFSIERRHQHFTFFKNLLRH